MPRKEQISREESPFHHRAFHKLSPLLQFLKPSPEPEMLQKAFPRGTSPGDFITMFNRLFQSHSRFPFCLIISSWKEMSRDVPRKTLHPTARKHGWERKTELIPARPRHPRIFRRKSKRHPLPTMDGKTEKEQGNRKTPNRTHDGTHSTKPLHEIVKTQKKIPLRWKTLQYPQNPQKTRIKSPRKKPKERPKESISGKPSGKTDLPSLLNMLIQKIGQPRKITS
jgi:hypothetical protein